MIEITDHGRLRTVTLMRQEAKNAMNAAMWDGLAEALNDAEQAAGVAVVVITGSGDSFSAGQDIIEMGRMAMGERIEVLASKPIGSLMASKRTIVDPIRAALHEAHARENGEFAVLMGSPANIEAMTAFAEKRPPNFDGID